MRIEPRSFVLPNAAAFVTEIGYHLPSSYQASPRFRSAALRPYFFHIRCHRPALSAVLGLAALAVTVQPASADVKLCNSTSSRIGVSIGYQDPRGWATEGWWTISSQTCETLLKGTVPSQFIYVHAVDYDRGGEWAGANFMCTDDKSFVIRGVQDCSKRGFKRSGFFEVNTGDAKEWTVRLTDPEPGSGKTQ